MVGSKLAPLSIQHLHNTHTHTHIHTSTYIHPHTQTWTPKFWCFDIMMTQHVKTVLVVSGSGSMVKIQLEGD